MNEKKSNAPVIVVVILVVLAIPCLLGALVVGGSAIVFWKASEREMHQHAQEAITRQADTLPPVEAESSPPAQQE
jgi:hypothetical protein